jgi:hypothetical protein
MSAQQPIPLRADPAALRQAERRSFVRALTACVFSPPSSLVSPEQYVAKTWPDDVQAARITRAVSGPATTTGNAALQLSIVGLFRSLAPTSAALQLFDRGLSVDLRGLASIRIPSITTALPTASFIAEGESAPALNLNFTSNQVGPVKKLSIISAVSEELESAGPELASTAIGRVLGDAVTKSLDVVVFGVQAADGITPAGLFHGVTPLTAWAAGPGAMVEDLGSLAGAIAGANIDPAGIIYVASAREAQVIKAAVGPRFDSPILMSLGMPDKSVAAFAPAAVLSGFGDLPQIETSRQALLNVANPAAQIVAAGGTVAAPSYSVFQMRLIAIKLRIFAAFGCVSGGAQIINSVNW